MSQRNNPYSTRWEKPRKNAKFTKKEMSLYNAIRILQGAILIAGVPIILENELYVSALEIWSRLFPEYFNALLKMVISADRDIEIGEAYPDFAFAYFIAVFKDLDVMVNGEVDNNLHYFNRYF